MNLCVFPSPQGVGVTRDLTCQHPALRPRKSGRRRFGSGIFSFWFEVALGRSLPLTFMLSFHADTAFQDSFFHKILYWPRRPTLTPCKILVRGVDSRPPALPSRSLEAAPAAPLPQEAVSSAFAWGKVSWAGRVITPGPPRPPPPYRKCLSGRRAFCCWVRGYLEKKRRRDRGRSRKLEGKRVRENEWGRRGSLRATRRSNLKVVKLDLQDCRAA